MKPRESRQKASIRSFGLIDICKYYSGGNTVIRRVNWTSDFSHSARAASQRILYVPCREKELSSQFQESSIPARPNVWKWPNSYYNPFDGGVNFGRVPSLMANCLANCRRRGVMFVAMTLSVTFFFLHWGLIMSSRRGLPRTARVVPGFALLRTSRHDGRIGIWPLKWVKSLKL
jgi:hypothetical protein